DVFLSPAGLEFAAGVQARTAESLATLSDRLAPDRRRLQTCWRGCSAGERPDAGRQDDPNPPRAGRERRRRRSLHPPPARCPHMLRRMTTSYFVTDVRRPGVSGAGIA